MHALHNSMLTFLIRTKENLHWSHLSQCQMNFLQRVLYRESCEFQISRQLAYLNYRNCFEVSTIESVQSETKKKSWQRNCLYTSWRIFAIYSWHSTVHHLQQTYHLLSQRTLHSKVGGFQWNVDIQVAEVALQANLVTCTEVYQKFADACFLFVFQWCFSPQQKEHIKG